MLPWSTELAGRLDEHVIDSPLLRGNPLGDPTERPLEVYVPPGYDDEPDRRYPSVYVLQGYTGMLPMWHNRSPFRPTFPEAVDQLFATGVAPPCLVVFVDAWTAYGGSQFVDSPATGRYHSYPSARAGRSPTPPHPRSCRRRRLPDGLVRGGAGDRRQVEWRVRGDDHSDAASGPFRRPGQPRRRRAL